MATGTPVGNFVFPRKPRGGGSLITGDDAKSRVDKVSVVPKRLNTNTDEGPKPRLALHRIKSGSLTLPRAVSGYDIYSALARREQPRDDREGKETIWTTRHAHEKKTSRLPKWRGISLASSFPFRFLFFASTEALY